MVTTTLAVSGAVLVKAGKNRSIDFETGAALVDSDEAIDVWIVDAESWVMAMTRINWVSKYSGLDANLKLILRDTVSSKAAMMAINYDMSGYTSRAEAETMLDVNNDQVLKGLSALRDFKTGPFIEGT